VTDASGCSQTVSVTVSDPPPIIPTTIVASNNIDLSVSGGTAPYAYQWSNGSNAQDQYGFGAGTYCVTITDASGCATTTCAVIVGGGNPTVSLNSQVKNTACGTQCSGAIFLSANGGIGGYSYLWVGPNGLVSTTQNLSNVCAGSYCLTVTDANGHSATACYTVGQGQSQDLKIQSTNSAFCNFDPGNTSSVCEMVCPRSTVTYFVDPPVACGVPMNLSSAAWTVSGAERFSINGPEVVVVWGEAGPGLVEFGSNNPDLCFESSHCVTVVEEPVAQFITAPPQRTKRRDATLQGTNRTVQKPKSECRNQGELVRLPKQRRRIHH